MLGAAIAALAAVPAAAQSEEQMPVADNAAEETAADDNVIVVSGYRQSLERAIDLKRETIGFSDSIVATDIADFPEQNLSEALQRVPSMRALATGSRSRSTIWPPLRDRVDAMSNSTCSHRN